MSHQLLKIFSSQYRGKICLVFVLVGLAFFALPAHASAAGYGESCSPANDTCTAPYKCITVAGVSKCASNYLPNIPTPLDVLGMAAKGVVTWFAEPVIEWVVNSLEYILSYLIAFLLALGGWFIDFSLSLNSEVFTLPVVLIGWRITRDIANLGFVLGIIVIAFATIVRSETYGIKKTLFKLIVIAVLINFSLSICGVFLDASAIATNFFLSKATPNGTIALSQAITQAFNPQKLWQVKPEGIPSITTGSGMLTSIASLFFVIIFSWMGVVTYFALGFMLLVRFVYIAFLLILAPIAWLGWIFPGLSVGGQGHIASMWSEKFVKWTFFPPIVAFFIYLALYTVQYQSAIQSITNPNSAASALSGALAIGSATTNANVSFSATIGSMFIFCGLLMGGLIAANKMSITGAGIAQNYAHKAEKYLGSAARGTGRLIGRSALTVGSKKDEYGETTSWAQRRASQLATIPVLGRLGGRQLSRAVTGQAKEFRGDIDKLQKDKWSRATNADLDNAANNLTRFSSNIERAAIAKEVAARKRHEAKDANGNSALNDGTLQKLIEAAERTGVDKDIKKDILANNPTEAEAKLFKSEVFGKENEKMTQDEAMRLYSPASNASKLTLEALENAKLVMSKNFNERYMSEIANNGGLDQQKAMMKTITDNFDPANATKLERIQKILERIDQDISETRDREGDTAEGKAIITALQQEKKKQKSAESAIWKDQDGNDIDAIKDAARKYKFALQQPALAGEISAARVSSADAEREVKIIIDDARSKAGPKAPPKSNLNPADFIT